VRRIFGDSLGLEGHVAELSLALEPVSVRLYALSLEWDDLALAPQSTLTEGVEFAGSHALGDWKLLYEVEVATQSDIENNPRTVDADYFNGMLGAAGTAATVRLGYEKLFGGSQGSFGTPLATLHKFNGWADLFLATPADGLLDTYLQADGKRGSLGWLVRYHEFEAASGGASYGDEIDGQLAYQTSWKQTFALTWALYDADRFAVDTDKWMVWTSYSF